MLSTWTKYNVIVDLMELIQVDTAGKKLGDGKRDMEEVLDSIKTAKGNLEESLNNAREVNSSRGYLPFSFKGRFLMKKD